MAAFKFILNALVLFMSLVKCEKITLSLNQGVCLCVNEPNVVAVSDRKYFLSVIGSKPFQSSSNIVHL